MPATYRDYFGQRIAIEGIAVGTGVMNQRVQNGDVVVATTYGSVTIMQAVPKGIKTINTAYVVVAPTNGGPRDGLVFCIFGRGDFEEAAQITKDRVIFVGGVVRSLEIDSSGAPKIVLNGCRVNPNM